METLKLILCATVLGAALLAAAIYGQSRLPRSSECEATYQLDSNFRPSTWKAVGWKVQDGFPPINCKMPKDKIVYEDGTWEWK